MKKIILDIIHFIKENIVGIVIFGILFICLLCSISALSVSKSNSVFIESVSHILNSFISNS